jgi:hypothetical protein
MPFPNSTRLPVILAFPSPSAAEDSLTNIEKMHSAMAWIGCVIFLMQFLTCGCQQLHVTSATWAVRESCAGGFITVPDPSDQWSYSFPANELNVNAYFDVRFDQDAYFYHGDCTNVRYCNQPVVAPCCVACDPNNRPNPIANDSRNALNCICPTYADTLCLDAASSYVNCRELGSRRRNSSSVFSATAPIFSLLGDRSAAKWTCTSTQELLPILSKPSSFGPSRVSTATRYGSAPIVTPVIPSITYVMS